MTRTSQRTNVIIAFAASAVLFAQSDVVPIKSQKHSSLPDTRKIIGSSIEATQRQWQARLHYTYLERDENRRRDLAGHLKSEDVDVSRTILVNGVLSINLWNATVDRHRSGRNGNRKRNSIS
jgi:hypothetical protein